MIRYVSFGADISCNGETCVEYTGAVPAPYSSLESWYRSANKGDQMCYWKIVDGNLTFDGSTANKRTDCPTTDWVVEQGENDGWTYRIWSSGIKECWLTGSKENMDFTQATLHSGFYYFVFSRNFPLEFTEPPCAFADGGSTDIINFLRIAAVTTTRVSLWALCLENKDSDTTINYHIYAKGY